MRAIRPTYNLQKIRKSQKYTEFRQHPNYMSSYIKGASAQVFYDCDDKADTASYKSFTEVNPEARAQEAPAHRQEF